MVCEQKSMSTRGVSIGNEDESKHGFDKPYEGSIGTSRVYMIGWHNLRDESKILAYSHLIRAERKWYFNDSFVGFAFVIDGSQGYIVKSSLTGHKGRLYYSTQVLMLEIEDALKRYDEEKDIVDRLAENYKRKNIMEL